MTDSPIPGEVRMMGGKEYRFIEREPEGDKWEAVASPIPAAPSDVAGVVERLEKYLAERAKLRQVDKDLIHGLHSGDDIRESDLTVTDLRAILSHVQSLSHDREVMRGALERIADGPWPDDVADPEAQCRFDERIARAALASLKGGA